MNAGIRAGSRYAGGLLLIALLFPGVRRADACTGMYAGKGVTSDGSVLIGRTVDFSPYNATMIQQICEAGTQVAFNGTLNRYRYVSVLKSTALSAGRYAGSAVNEKGLAVSATVTGATRAAALGNDPFVPLDHGGVGEPNLPPITSSGTPRAQAKR